MSESRWVLLANLVVTLFMTGVIWYVQVAHYPLFAQVGRAAFPGYHAIHNNATTAVVALPMLVELGLSLLLVAARPPEVSLPVALALLALTALIWAATFFLSVPLHAQLDVNGYAIETINQLVNTNWIRTLAWSARGVILTAVVAVVMMKP